MEVSRMKEMAVDAMVKYSDNEEIYRLAQALEEAAEQLEPVERDVRQGGLYVHA